MAVDFKVLSVRLEREVFSRLKAYAEANGMKMQAVVTRLILTLPPTKKGQNT